MSAFVRIAFIFLATFSLLFGEIDYQLEAQNIKRVFNEAVELYKNGKNQEAREATQTAYFSHFENLEAGIRINLGQKKSYAMEKQFGEIRKAIKAQKPVNEIETMIANLNNEINEILPIISSGAKLVAQKSDDGGLADAGLSDNSVATELDTPWKNILEQIDISLNNAALSHAANDKNALISELNKIKFDLYRNSNLEIAIRRFVSSKTDQMIQQVMGNAISKNLSLDSEAFAQNLKDIKELVLTAISQLPKEADELAPASSDADGKKADFAPVVANIRFKMAAALALYEAGEIKPAMSDAGDIYFDEYEASGMEAKIGAIDSSLKTATEASFGRIIALMKSGAPASKIASEQENLFNLLNESVAKTSGEAGGWTLFLYSLTIILREGFEALIIIAAVIAYLYKSGNAAKTNLVYSATGTAIVLSFVVAWALNMVFGAAVAGASREILEGSVMLVATALLFYVGFWLLSNASAKKWGEYIKSEVAAKLSSGQNRALWWVVFLAVFREGAETVLFYQALIFDASGANEYMMLLGGFIFGIIALIISYFIFKIFSLKIPIKQFFIGTSAIIFYMSIAFVGKGVSELVEGKVLAPHIIESLPSVPWLGLYPYYESLVVQILMILALIIGGTIIVNKNRKPILNKGE